MKAIVLISGGLDSTLSARLMQGLGIELIALNTTSPFCLCNRRSSPGCSHAAGDLTRELGLKLIRVNVAEEFLEIVKRPKHGYGSNMNPCIDCRILLFRKAKKAMQEEGASFIVTGEVLGQRPMSQHKQALRIIEEESGLTGLVLRPLSARLLPETIPEKEGWVDRNKLLNFSGRSRRPQMQLAEGLNIKDYPCSAGGCLLTDPGFSQRLKELLAHKEELSLLSVELLKVGRHFRLAPAVRLIVGRHEKENQRLEELARQGDYLFYPPEDIVGPAALGRGVFNPHLIQLAGSITLRYCDINGSASADILYKTGTVLERDCPCLVRVSSVSPIEEEKLNALRI